jgi:hypothetical protein
MEPIPEFDCVWCGNTMKAHELYMCYHCMDHPVCSAGCWKKFRLSGLHHCVGKSGSVGAAICDETPVGDECCVGGKHGGGSYHEKMSEGEYHRGSNKVRVSPEKAKMILRDKTIRGHPITPRQQRYFGWIAGMGR